MGLYSAADAEDWREYILAAQRKIAIARHHLESLREQPAPMAGPSIPEQPYFEGVINAFVSATEQAARAINVARGGNGNAQPLSILLRQIPASNTTTRLKTWDGNPIVRDVRSVRNRAAHRYYKKKASATPARCRTRPMEAATTAHGS